MFKFVSELTRLYVFSIENTYQNNFFHRETLTILKCWNILMLLLAYKNIYKNNNYVVVWRKNCKKSEFITFFFNEIKSFRIFTFQRTNPNFSLKINFYYLNWVQVHLLPEVNSCSGWKKRIAEKTHIEVFEKHQKTIFEINL